MPDLPIRTRLPDGYKESPFSDLLDVVREKTRVKDENGVISVKGYCDAWQIDRFGKTFNVVVIGMFGQLSITIKEHKPKTSASP